MDEGRRGGLDWRKRLWAWWEGYELPRDKAQASADAAEAAASGARPPAGPPLSEADRKANTSRFGKPLWSASRIQVAEKIWGTGFSTPGGDDFIPYLIKPLGLNPKFSVLDLSAGLGGATRLMAKSYGCWVTGLEASPVLAAAAQERSVMAGLAKQAAIAHYDPDNLKLAKRFDCIFSKEFFVFVRNREALTDAMEACLKPGGQLLFTDYVLEGAGGAALKAWIDHEPMEPHPRTLAQVVDSLQQRNLDIRITEDITDRHRSLIVGAIQTLTGFLEKHALDQETKLAVLDEVELWARRVAALQDGLRCYRFFALKFKDAPEA
jgi:SAM-dependent methyltransferase